MTRILSEDPNYSYSPNPAPHKLGYDPHLDAIPEDYASRRKAEEQLKNYNGLYRDSISDYQTSAYEIATILGTATEKKQNLGQSSFKDVIVPYSAQPDLDRITTQNKSAPLAVANSENPKAPIPIEPKLQLSNVATEKPALESPKMSAESANKSTGIFHRFIDWVTGIFSKKENPSVEYEEVDGVRKKVQDPTQRNAEAIRDCLKRMNESLDKMRELVQQNTVTGPNADVELTMMFLLLIHSVKMKDEFRKLEMIDTNKFMMDSQTRFKEAQKKYFEALHDTTWLAKWPTWIIKGLTYGGTAAIIGSLGIAAAAVIAGLATGGVAAVLGALGAVAAYYGVLQAVGFIATGSGEIFKAAVNYKTEKHTATMKVARNEQERSTFDIQECMQTTMDSLREMTNTWGQLSTMQAEKYTTMSSFKN